MRLSRFIYAGFILIFLTSHLVPALAPLAQALREYFYLVAPAFLAGLALASVIDVFVPREIVSSFLGRGGFGDVWRASVLGFLASSCSHGCLALSVELYKKGASCAAFLSFLLASPWASLPVTVLLLRLFGWKGLLIIGLAFAVSLITGMGVVYLSRRGWITGPAPAAPQTTVFWKELLWANLRANAKPRVFLPQMAQSAASLLGMILPWVALGILVSALAGTYAAHGMQMYLGKSLWGPPLTLLAASLIEVCSEGSAPVAFEIYRNTLALGSVFIFLEAGVITDITEISLVAANAGRRAAWALVLLSLPQVLLLGYLLNALV